MKLECRQCGGVMRKATLSSGNCAGLLLALVVIGIGLFISTTGVGAIIGVPMMLLGLFIGGKRRRVWKCRRCGCVLDRA